MDTLEQRSPAVGSNGDGAVEQEPKDLGFGTRVGGFNEGRLLNRDGSFAARREGLPFLSSLSLYHFFLDISWPAFFGYVVLTYVSANAIFAAAYLACGPHALTAPTPDHLAGRFAQAFFFSVQTFATIGYGQVGPRGLAANLIVTVEALVGLTTFALGTGILFARFSRPSARVIFSERAVVAPYRGRTALMFRITNGRRNQLIELEAKVLYSRLDGRLRKYDQLRLERTRVVFFPLSWTIVHPIDESSPLYGVTFEDLVSEQAEFLILLTGIDETFSQTVHTRSSYRGAEIVYGHRFANIYNPVGADGRISIDVRRISDTEPAADDLDMPLNSTQTWHHTGHFAGFAPDKLPGRNDTK